MDSNRYFDVIPRSHIRVNTISHWRLVARKKPTTPILDLLILSQPDRFGAVGINFFAIRCSIFGQVIDLQLCLVLERLAKAQAQQTQIDLR